MKPRIREILSVLLLGLMSQTSLASQVELNNAGFENGWQGWTDVDPSGSGTSLSGKAHGGENSVKLTEPSAFVSQVVAVEPNTNYRLSAYVLGVGNLGAKVGAEIYFEQQAKKTKKWTETEVVFNSGDFSVVTIFASYAGREGRFDDFSLASLDGAAVETSVRVITSSSGGSASGPGMPTEVSISS